MKARKSSRSSAKQASSHGRRIARYYGYNSVQNACDWAHDNDGDAIATTIGQSREIPGTVTVLIPVDVSITDVRRLLLKIIATLDAGDTPETIDAYSHTESVTGSATCDPN